MIKNHKKFQHGYILQYDVVKLIHTRTYPGFLQVDCYFECKCLILMKWHPINSRESVDAKFLKYWLLIDLAKSGNCADMCKCSNQVVFLFDSLTWVIHHAHVNIIFNILRSKYSCIAIFIRYNMLATVHVQTSVEISFLGSPKDSIFCTL